MRIVHHRLGEGRENTVYDVNKLGNSYNITERNVNIQTGPWAFYFIVAFITFFAGTVVFILCKRHQPLNYYVPIIEMYIYTIEYLIFGLINYFWPWLFYNVLLHFFLTSTILCQIISRLILWIFG